MPPLFMGEVFFLVVGSIEVFVHLYADFDGHDLPTHIDGDLHLSVLRSDFCEKSERGWEAHDNGTSIEKHPIGMVSIECDKN